MLIRASFSWSATTRCRLLSNNNFNTSIPIALANLRRLQTANMSNNDLHGGLAPLLLALPALQIL
jgi:hypothetical protein